MSRSFSRCWRGGGVTAVLALAVSACTDPGTGPFPNPQHQFVAANDEISPTGGLPSHPTLRGPITELYIGTTGRPELTDEELVTAVAEAGGKVIIGLKPPAARPTRETGLVPAMSETAVFSARADLAGLGVEITQTYRYMSFLAAQVPAALAPAIRKLPFVNYVNPERSWPLASTQDTSWGVFKVRAPQAWNLFGYRGQMTHITVLDSGIDQTHWLSLSGDGPAGLIDCLHASPPWYNCYDDIPHGSHVAGIAAARDNESGYLGLAHMPGGTSSVKVCDFTGCIPSAIKTGLDWAISKGYARHVVNMSLGGCEDNLEIREAVERASNAGLLLVAAAGNTNNCPAIPHNQVLWPAKYPEVLAVSGTLETDLLAPSTFVCPITPTPPAAGSRYGPEIELAAPFWAYSMKLNGTYGIDCGTSMAAPVVTGIAAMVWHQNPTWSAGQVRSHLKTTAIDLGPAGFDQQYGWGRVDALSALGPRVSISGTTAIWEAGSYTWSALASGGTGSYTYLWEYSPDATGGSFTPVGTSASYQRQITEADPVYFTLRVTVTSGTQASAQLTVTNYISNPCFPEIIC